MLVCLNDNRGIAMIAVIDYRAGNLTSVRLALDTIGVKAVITSDPATILAAERVIFPGVGAARAAMNNLSDLGLTDCIRSVVAGGTPFLGICLGTQIIMQHSEENDGTDTLGLVPGNVRLFMPTSPRDKVPQMGWNSVDMVRPHPVFDNIEDHSEFYFVHSYYPEPADPVHRIATTAYAGVVFASVIGLGNLLATQFHPEKSGRIGLALLDNFCKWSGTC
jgi:glutamine amidotransferase